MDPLHSVRALASCCLCCGSSLASRHQRQCCGCGKEGQGNVIPCAQPEVVEQAHLSAKAARLHCPVHLVSHGKRFTEQHAAAVHHQPALLLGAQAADRATLARLEHMGGSLGQQHDVPMCHGEQQHHLRRNQQSPQRLQQM